MVASKEKDAISRLTDSAETAMYEGDGACLLRFYQPDGTTSLYRFSTKFEADGIAFEEPSDQMFSFNSPIGACPECEGFGKVIGIDEHLVIPNRSLSVYDGAVVCWRGEVMGEWKDMVIRGAEKPVSRSSPPTLNLQTNSAACYGKAPLTSKESMLSSRWYRKISTKYNTA